MPKAIYTINKKLWHKLCCALMWQKTMTLEGQRAKGLYDLGAV